MLINMPKTIRIEFDLFKDLYVYATRHAEPNDLQFKRIIFAVKRKLDALMKHELYSLYKAGASEKVRERAREKYLDAACILESFQWGAEQDANVAHGENVDSNLYDDRVYPMDCFEARRAEQDLIEQHLPHADESESLGDKSTTDSYELPF